MIKKENAYVVFRILVGVLFLQHGLQKLFGLLGGAQQELFSLLGLAGIIEFVVGIFLISGLFVGVSAFIGGLTMIVAYFMFHVSNGFWPILNGGELALLYLAAFIILATQGSGKLTLQKWLKSK